MNFGTRTDEGESRRIIDRAIERGVTVLDTANFYGDGASERIVGRAIAGRRDSVTLATKCGLVRRGGAAEGLSAVAIRRALEESLARLAVERVDIYYLHAPDPLVPFAESLAAIDELARGGRIGRLGLSNFASWQILEIDGLATANGGLRPAIAQQIYNLLIRQLDIEYWRFAAAHPIHTTVYNPLAGGLLARDAERGEAPPAGSRLAVQAHYRRRYGSERMFERVVAYRGLAREAGLTLLELAYSWLAGRPGVDSILVGPATVAHLDAAIDACARPLSQGTRAAIDTLHRDFAGTDACYAR